MRSRQMQPPARSLKQDFDHLNPANWSSSCQEVKEGALALSLRLRQDELDSPVRPRRADVAVLHLVFYALL